MYLTKLMHAGISKFYLEHLSYAIILDTVYLMGVHPVLEYHPNRMHVKHRFGSFISIIRQVLSIWS